MRHGRVFGMLASAGVLAFPVQVTAPVQPGRGLAVGPAAPETAGERRVALVIGNSAYLNSPLKNPVNDARAMALALQGCGFSVTKLENARRVEMRQALRDFASHIDHGGVGLFYFAGHGMAVKGRNYLIPVDADIQSDDEVEDQALGADAVTGKMEAAKNRVNVIILDACRNNPFASASRSGAHGLAQMDAPAGSFIAYATAPGSTAADGAGANGLYTQYLLRAMTEPGLKLEEVFKRVRIGVKEASADQQVPWDSSSMTGDFYFKAGAGAAPAAPEPVPAGAPAARKGDDLLREAMAAYTGRGGTRNLQDALLLFIQAADLENPEAQGRLGAMYAFGIGTPINPVQAVAYFRKAADQGNPQGENGLGLACLGNLPGCGLEKDEAKAFEWFARAARQEYPYGLRNLALCYAGGFGVARDEGRALMNYRKAVATALAQLDQGDPGIPFLLGVLYETGGGVEKDAVQAAAWYRKAADQGEPRSQVRLGLMYQQGLGVAKDPVQAARWFRAAADQGFPEGEFDLGVSLERGEGLAKDAAEALAWYRKAAEHGQAMAEYDLGAHFYNGTGVPQEYRTAVAWYRKAVDQGNPQAEFDLGVCYYLGQGVVQDFAEATRLYRLAADHGYAIAQNNLGFCYQNGQGVGRDPVAAFAWYQKAADQGLPLAERNLGTLYESGTGVGKDLAQAKLYYQKAAAQGDADASKALARLGSR